MNRNKLNEMYKLIEKAKILDRVGKENESLEIYLDILKNYTPNTSFCYERPAIILEKKKRYNEAREICLKAIELIESQKLGGTVDKFKHRLKRIDEKLAESKENFDKNNTTKKNINFKVLSLLTITLLAIIGFIIYANTPKKSPYDNIYIDMENFDKKTTLTGSMFKDIDGNDLPKLTSDMIEYAKSICNQNPEVDNSLIIIQNGTLGFGILLNQNISESRAKTISREFIKALSNKAAEKNENLSSPTKVSYGGLYDYYDVLIAIGFGPNNIEYKASMNKKTNVLFFRK